MFLNGLIVVRTNNSIVTSIFPVVYFDTSLPDVAARNAPKSFTNFLFSVNAWWPWPFSDLWRYSTMVDAYVHDLHCRCFHASWQITWEGYVLLHLLSGVPETLETCRWYRIRNLYMCSVIQRHLQSMMDPLNWLGGSNEHKLTHMASALFRWEHWGICWWQCG